VEVAGEGIEALRSTVSASYDAIVLDIKMPGMDGVEFARRYRAGGGQSPIVVISAARGAAAEAARIERCTFLAKPFEVDELVETIAAALPDV
jgi:DNA-binding response OmpR family regulator